MMRYVLFFLAVLVLCGCGGGKPKTGDKPAAPGAAAERSEPPEARVMREVGQLMGQGKTNDAIRVLESAYKSRANRAARGHLFGELLRLKLAAGQVEDATARYLRAVQKKDEELAQGGFDAVPAYHHGKGDMDAMLAWADRLLALPLSKEMRQRTVLLRLHVLLVTGKTEALADMVPECVRVFGDEAGRQALGPIARNLVMKEQYPAAEKFLAAVEAAAGDSAALKTLVATERVQLLAMQGQWEQAEAAFRTAAPMLSDEELAASLGNVAAVANRRKTPAETDRFTRFVLEQPGDKARAVQRAASAWVNAVTAATNYAAVPARLEQLLAWKVPADVVAPLYFREFYKVAQVGAPQLEAMAAVGNALAPAVQKQENSDAICTLLLDGAFLREDYAGALALLEKGVPGRDPDWHGMAICKVKAHLALQKGDTAEAVERFREFMSYVDKTWKEPEQDPSTGILYTKEMTLGFNARRIGDILKKAGDQNGASRSYAEARVYYEKALAESKPESDAHGKIKEELALLAEAAKPAEPAAPPAGEK